MEGGKGEDVTLLPVRRRRAGGHTGGRRSDPDQPLLKLPKVTAGTQGSPPGSGMDAAGGDPRSRRHAGGDQAACRYGSGASDLPARQEKQRVRTETASYLNQASPVDPNRPEVDFSLMWDTQSKGQLASAHFLPPQSPDGFAAKPVGVTDAASTDSALSGSSPSGLGYGPGEGGSFPPHRDPLAPPPPGGSGGRRKRFLCSICNRTYATAQNLDVHMRIHTGQRPFSCEQCGKKFTQSAHLKSHATVHSGERPYTCQVCARSFIVRYSLKLHVSKCHPNVPNE